MLAVRCASRDEDIVALRIHNLLCTALSDLPHPILLHPSFLSNPSVQILSGGLQAVSSILSNGK
jgi:hypothetical protein